MAQEDKKPQDGEQAKQGLRRLIVTIFGSLLAAALLPLKRHAAVRTKEAEKPQVPERYLPKWGMVIDLDKCTGCGTCMVACAVENNLPLQNRHDMEQERVIRWMRLLSLSLSDGELPNGKARLMPLCCQHCDNSPCIRVCPVRATYKNDEGMIAQIYPRCIGCRYCVNNCPYTCKFFNWREPHWPDPMDSALNPDVSLRNKGVTEKCTFCHHRLLRAKEEASAGGRGVKNGDFVPACVEACPAGAIYFGDLNDHSSKVAQLLKHDRGRVFRMLEDLGTEPKVYYLMEG